MNNLNTDGVTVQRGMRRLPFPQSEYNTNNANVKAIVSMLGGADNSATDLWWAKEKLNQNVKIIFIMKTSKLKKIIYGIGISLFFRRDS